MNNTYILITFLVLCWTLNPFLKKQASGKLTSDEFLIFNHGLCTVVVVVHFIYLAYQNKCDINCIKKLNHKEILYSIAGALTTVLASLALIKLLKDNDATDIIPHIQPIVIILTILIGYFIFKENVTKNKVIGAALIVVGLFIINKKTPII